MKTISAERLRELLPGARLFDTRFGAEDQDGIPGARALTLEQAQAGELPDVPRDEPLYLICERGPVSELVGLYLEAAGFAEVYTVAGGMKAWRELGNREADIGT